MTERRWKIYGGRDPVTVPAYTPGEIAGYLRLPKSTVRAWVAGQKHFEPVIFPADPKTFELSFQNLIEVHVLSVIRRQREVPLTKVRHAIQVLRRELKTDHPLADANMATVGRRIYAEVAGKYKLVSESDPQGSFDALVSLYLQRIERDPKNVPIRLFPWILGRPSKPDDVKHDPGPKVVISPTISFGRPCMAGTGIRTSIVFSRWKAGDKMSELAADYTQPIENVEEAIRYEENSGAPAAA